MAGELIGFPLEAGEGLVCCVAADFTCGIIILV